MKDTPRTLFFMVGGIFLPRLYFAAIEILKERGVLVTDKNRLQINQLENDLLTGAIPEQDFFPSLSSCTSIHNPLNRADFLKKCRIESGLLALVKELGSDKQGILLSDYPKPWLAECDRGGYPTSLFSRVIYLEEMDCSNIHAAVMDRLEKSKLLKPGECVWVDADSTRTSIALRRGIDAVIYVDESRLRRDLHLMNIL